jgi:hypothetical protein
MTEKSYVSIERRICIVCGAQYDTNSLLIDGRLQASLDKYTVTGWGLCSTDQQLYKAGFVALVEVDPAKSDSPFEDGCVRPDQVYRTGICAHLRRDIAVQVLNIPIRPSQPCVFVEPGVIQRLQTAMPVSKDPADEIRSAPKASLH